MMMAIFERSKEIGTLKAMGMTDRQIFQNFTCEGAILGAMGGIPGAIAGFILISILSHVGINFEGSVQNIDMPIEYVIKPAIRMSDLIIAVVLSVTVPALAAMIPARHTAKMMPAEALKK